MVFLKHRGCEFVAKKTNENKPNVCIFVAVPINLDYVCEACVYSSCDVTCGLGEQVGSMRCVLLDKDMVTVLDEHDVKCPHQACYISCNTPDETDVVSAETVTSHVTTTSTAETTDDAGSGTYHAATDNYEI